MIELTLWLIEEATLMEFIIELKNNLSIIDILV